jgi:hypothetical protein
VIAIEGDGGTGIGGLATVDGAAVGVATGGGT